MVGRADELARLLAHVDRAAAGRASAVLLAGDAGVGKTRLLDELDRPGRRARGPGAHRPLRRPRRRRPALPAVRRPAAPGGRRPRPRARRPRPTRRSPGCSPAARRRCPPVPPAGEGRDLGRPLPNRAAPQPVDDGRLQLFESVAGAASASWPPPARCCSCWRTCTGPTGPAATCCATCWPGWSTSRSPWSRPTAPTTCTAGTRCGRCSPSWCGCPASSGSSSAPLPDAEVGALVRGLAGRRRACPSDRRRRRRPRRGQRVLRRGAAGRRPARRGAAARR